MPEAPEVQTVLSTLEHQIKGTKILNVEVFYPKLIQNMDVSDFCEQLKNQTFCDFFRKNKDLQQITQTKDAHQ